MDWVRSEWAVPEPCQVAGTRLLPFCLGFHLLFKRLGLPFAGSPAADAMPGQILVGILLCAQPYPVTVDELHEGTWGKTQTDWLAKVMKRRTNIEDSERRFREYLIDGYRMPALYRTAQADGISMSAPWENLLKIRLTMAGLTELEALTGYLPGRWVDYFTALEIGAADRCDDPKRWRKLFVTRDDAERIESLKEAAGRG